MLALDHLSKTYADGTRALADVTLDVREAEIVALVAEALSSRQIAERLSISEKTVGNHISNIFAKLQVTDRSQAIVRALRGGLDPSPGPSPTGEGSR